MRLAIVVLSAALAGCASIRPFVPLGCAVALAACNVADSCAMCDAPCSNASTADHGDTQRALQCVQCLEACAATTR